MRSLSKCRKALSPVVAAIILIAVTVAVSIAVAAWMGALTFSFMGGTETIDVKHITWSSNATDPARYFIIQFKNTGTSAASIDHVSVNNAAVSSDNVNATLPESVPAAGTKSYKVTYTWTSGDPYDIAVVTSKNNPFAKRVTGGVDY